MVNNMEINRNPNNNNNNTNNNTTTSSFNKTKPGSFNGTR